MSPPVIDVSPLCTTKDPSNPSVQAVAQQLRDAFSSWGLIQITGHQIPSSLQQDIHILRCSKTFFDLPEQKKLAIDVRTGGPAWRGYMPFSGESTHGVVDRKEGVYFGPEHPATHELNGMPLHGVNQFPPDADVPGMRDAVLKYIELITELGKTLTMGLSMALALDPRYMNAHLLEPEPVALFRFFMYPPNEIGASGGSGIGEHSDFGYLTILAQDSPGLQVKSPSGDWVDVPVIQDALIVNVGDMFDMLTGGRFVSPRHRALSPPFGGPHVTQDQYPLTEAKKEGAKARWAQTTFTNVEGHWWQYLAKKVKKVFPDLNLPDFEANSSISTRFNAVVPVPVGAS